MFPGALGQEGCNEDQCTLLRALGNSLFKFCLQLVFLADAKRPIVAFYAQWCVAETKPGQRTGHFKALETLQDCLPSVFKREVASLLLPGQSVCVRKCATSTNCKPYSTKEEEIAGKHIEFWTQELSPYSDQIAVVSVGGKSTDNIMKKKSFTSA